MARAPRVVAGAVLVVVLLAGAASAASAGDGDGDGRADLAFGSPHDNEKAPEGGSVAVRMSGGGTGFFTNPEPGAHLGASVAWGDFNGDGYDDLVVGHPDEDVNGRTDAGAITVIPGRSGGLDAPESYSLHAGSTNVPTDVEAGNRFGAALAAGEFNGDGRDDLVIGVPGQDVDGIIDAGSIVLISGAGHGLPHHLYRREITENTFMIPGSAEAGDRFGSVLAAGELTWDARRDDVLVGTPGEDVHGLGDAGAVTLIPGGRNGLTKDGAHQFYEDSPSVPGTSEAGDGFGAALDTGRIRGGTRDQIVVGSPDEDVRTVVDAGAVTWLHNSQDPESTGIEGGAQITENSLTVPGSSETGDAFGTAVAAGDLNADGFADVLVGTPLEDIHGIVDAGAFTVLKASPRRFGLGRNSFQSYSGSHYMEGTTAETGDRLGASVWLGRLNADPYVDFAIGAPGEDVHAIVDAGAALVILPRRPTFTVSSYGFVRQVYPGSGIPGTATANDQFGAVLA